jgi:hypothetical protein
MQKVRCHPLLGLQLLIGLLILFSFNVSTYKTLFQTFLYSTFSLSLNLLYLALEDGSPLFQQVFTRRT